MMQFDRITLGRQAKELGFVRDTFEKVCRLADVLAFMQSDALLSGSLALKGGTAISPIAVFKTGSEGIVKPTGACYNYKGRFKKSDVHGQRRTCPAAVQEG